MILAKVKWQTCLVYLVDILFFSRTPDSHIEHADEMLTLLGRAEITLKAPKWHFFQEELEYLGHAIWPGRVLVNEKKTKTLRDSICPKMQSQMKSFLGKGSVDSFFLSSSKRARPLAALTITKLLKDIPTSTGEEAEEFETLKELLLTTPVQALHRAHGQ